MSVVSVAPGLTFRAVVADCNALWKVIEPAGPQVWGCEVVDEPIELDGGRTIPGEYAGHTDVFLESDIIRRASMQTAMADLIADTGRFYDSLELGAVLHYHDAFGRFVRCEAVTHNGQRALRPTALVGAWQSIDLPRRNPDGTVNVPYHAKRILEGGDPWRPSLSTLYEHPSYTGPIDDPRTMTPISLTVEAMTDGQADQARLVGLVQSIRAECESRQEPAKILARVGELVAQA